VKLAVNEVLGFSRKLGSLVIIICGLKGLGTVLVPFYSSYYYGHDFYNFVTGASFALANLNAGKLPSLSVTGVYTAPFLLLAPFFWLWTILPVAHPSLAEMAAGPSTSEYLLVLIMKIPILLSDLLAGFLTALIVHRATRSNEDARKAFFVWYLNPFNVFWMYYFGGFDVVPTSVLLLAVLFGNCKQWFRSGFSLAVAGMLRIFPFLLLPFFLTYSYRDKPRSSAKLLISLLVPILCVVLTQVSVIGSVSGVLAAIINIPLLQSWLLQHYGYSITPGLFKLGAFLLAIQFYIVWRYWKNDLSQSLVYLTIAPLLALFIASYTEPYHFIWISPFLTAYYFMERDRLQLFVLTFVFASLFVAGFTTPHPLFPFLPLLAGFFYGIEAAYLVKLNLGAAKSQIRRVLMGIRIS
jgi:hypothetical protein